MDLTGGRAHHTCMSEGDEIPDPVNVFEGLKTGDPLAVVYGDDESPSSERVMMDYLADGVACCDVPSGRQTRRRTAQTDCLANQPRSSGKISVESERVCYQPPCLCLTPLIFILLHKNVSPCGTTSSNQ